MMPWVAGLYHVYQAVLEPFCILKLDASADGNAEYMKSFGDLNGEWNFPFFFSPGRMTA